MAVSYAEVLARNIRAARSRAGLEQEPTAARMRTLGHTAWRRQTVAAVERGKRRLTAEEAFSLAIALGTTVINLMSPTRDDEAVELSGSPLPVLPFAVAAHIVSSGNLGWVTWQDDNPILRDRPDTNLDEVMGQMASDIRRQMP
jgi:transcriptional regulator with XRE-family HTH domain